MFVPMISKTILAASLVAVISASVILPAMATSFASWQSVTGSSVTARNDKTTTLSVQASDIVPRHTSLAAGFAWIYSGGPDTAFVVVTHDGLRDSAQNPDGWHVHSVLLGGTPSVSNACILGASPDTNAGISIQGNTINVNVRNSEFTSSLSGTVVGFSVVQDSACGSGLGVDIVP